MKFEEIKEHPNFNINQRVACISNDRTGMRDNVALTLNKLYVIKDVNYITGKFGMRDVCIVYVMNDSGIIEKYSSKRFKIDRESILSELLD